MLSIGAFFFFFFSASSLSSAERRFGIPNVLMASLTTEEIDADEEAADSAGVDKLLLVPLFVLKRLRYASYLGKLIHERQ